MREIETALDDLSTGGCDAFMKLAPVTAWFPCQIGQCQFGGRGFATADAQASSDAVITTATELFRRNDMSPFSYLRGSYL